MKTFTKKIVAISLIFSFVIPALYSPIAAPRAQALIGVADMNIESVPQLLEYIFKTIGKGMAKKMVNDMVQASIKWANTGFDGNPTYPQDWEQYTRNTFRGAAGDYIKDSKLGFLCEPFQAQIRLSLIRASVPQDTRFECTLDTIGVNYENFINNFQEGGWEAFFNVTQSESGNPLSAYVTVKADLDDKVANQLGIVNQERALNDGFLSLKVCDPRMKNTKPTGEYQGQNLGGMSWDEVLEMYENLTLEEQTEFNRQFPGWNPYKKQGECLNDGTVTTPGSLIKGQLDKVLGSGLDSLISAQDLDAIVNAAISGLLGRYVFGPEGFFADKSSGAQRNEIIDIDGDRIEDGYDYDGDGQLDICHHGLKPRPANLPPAESWGPSSTNCIGSKNAVNSPYFAGICGSAAQTSSDLKRYQSYLVQNRVWDPLMYGSWMSRTSDAQHAVDNFINSIARIEARAFVDIFNNFTLYSTHLGAIVNSLVKDRDMRNDVGLGQGELRGDTITIERTTTANQERIDYLDRFVEAIGQCDDPDLGAIEDLSLPENTGDEAGSTDPNGSPLSCTTQNTLANVGQTVVWRMQTTHDDATGFRWTGDEITVASTTNPQNLFIAYETVGEKGASITAYFATSTSITRSCDATVTVTNQEFQ